MSHPPDPTTRHLVFDIDGVLAAPIDIQIERTLARCRGALGDEFIAQHKFEVGDCPHLVFPGVFALLRFARAHGLRLHVFRSGLADRNKELIDKILARAFPDPSGRPEVPIFSRRDCIDTSRFDLRGRDEKPRSAPSAEEEELQGLWWGQRKKRLAGVVVRPEEIGNTVFVEDDSTYVAGGEERNAIVVRDVLDYYPYRAESGEGFGAFHKAYYLAALLDDILSRADALDLSLAEAAVQMQITDLGQILDHHYPFQASIERVELYERGLGLLRRDDPSLRLHFDPPGPDGHW